MLSNHANAEPYIGVSIGKAKVNDFCDEFSGLTGVTCEDSDTSFKIFGGTKINKNFALEGSYNDFGQSILQGPGGSFTGEVTGLNLSAIGIIPASSSVDFFGKLGMLFWDLKLALNSTTVNDSISEDGNDISFGFGANINVSETFAIRAEFEKFQSVGKEDTTGESALSLISIGAVLLF
jgi:OOP family OmpA-OmpF porin